MLNFIVPYWEPAALPRPRHPWIPAFQAVSKLHPSEAMTPEIVIPAFQAVSKPLSLWERVAEGRCDPSQIQPLSLWERVAEGRVRAPNHPAAPIHCR